MSYTSVHRTVSLAMGAILVFMCVTGGYWAVQYRLLGAEKTSVKWLIQWHQGDIFGLDPSGVYVKGPFCTCVMGGTLVLGYTGYMQLNAKSMFNNRTIARRLHQVIALVVLAPLMFLALTGGIWALLRYNFGVPKQDIRLLIVLHQGCFESLFPYYPPIVAVGVLALCFTGLRLNFVEYVKAKK